MTSPLAVVTSAINVVVRPRTKLPKPAPAKAGTLHECMDDGQLMLEQLLQDAKLLDKRRRSVRFFVICDAIDNGSRRQVMRQLKLGCGFHESAVVLDPAMGAKAAQAAIDAQLQALHECDSQIKRAKTHLQDVHKRKDDEGSEVIVSYISFALELKWS